MDLNCSIGSINFRTPLILASGYITETPEFFLSARKFGCSGMVTRSLRKTVPQGRERTPAPRYHVFGRSSMLNCEWTNEHDWTNWLNQWGNDVTDTGSPLIVSLSARDADGASDLIRAFTDSGLPSAFEVNVSCAHSGALHGNLNVDVEYLKNTVNRARNATPLPIWVKLSYSPILGDMAKAAEQEGGDAIVCTNTIGPGLVIDTTSTRPKLGIRGGGGGVSGAAIFPIALWCVYTVSRAVAIPVVGSGGVESADHVLQMLMAGASAVQLYTAPALQGPKIFGTILGELEEFLLTNCQYDAITDLIGVSHRWAEAETNFDHIVPSINAERCTACGACLKACAFKAVRMEQVAKIGDNCVGCNACIGVCPTGAITTRFEKESNG